MSIRFRNENKINAWRIESEEMKAWSFLDTCSETIIIIYLKPSNTILIIGSANGGYNDDGHQQQSLSVPSTGIPRVSSQQNIIDNTTKAINFIQETFPGAHLVEQRQVCRCVCIYERLSQDISQDINEGLINCSQWRFFLPFSLYN